MRKVLVVFVLFLLLAPFVSSIESKASNKVLPLWGRFWGKEKSEIGIDVAVQKEGEDTYAYIVGRTDSFGNNFDAFLVKYDSSGNLIWNRTWGGNGDEYCFGVAVYSNTIYITGYTNSYGAGGYDAFLVKYDSYGTLLWSKTWGDSSDDFATDLFILSENIYLIGYTNSYGKGGYDTFILKYDKNGNVLWSDFWGGLQDEKALSLTADASGIYITGSTNSFSAIGSIDIFLLKYSTSGSYVINVTWGGDNEDIGQGISLGGGAVYIAGYTLSYGAGYKDAVLLKYNTDCNYIWNNTWGGATDDLAYGVFFQVDYVYTLGYTSSYGAGYKDLFLLKYDTTGKIYFNRTWGGNSDDSGIGICIYAGFIYITGYTYTFGAGDSDAILLCTNLNGEGGYGFLYASLVAEPPVIITCTDNSTIIVNVTDDGGNPIEKASIFFSMNPNLGSITAFKEVEVGTYEANYTPPDDIEYQTKIDMTVSATKVGYTEGRASGKLTINPKMKFDMQLSISSRSIYACIDISNLTVFLKEGGVGVGGAKITGILSPEIGNISSFDELENGKYEGIYSPPESIDSPSDITITVYAEKKGYLKAQISDIITINPAPKLSVKVTAENEKVIAGVSTSKITANVMYGNNPVSDAKLSATLIPFIGVISNFINIGSGNYVGTYTPPGSIETSTQVDIEVNASISKCIIGSGTIQITVEPQKKLSLRLNTNLEKVTAGRDKAIITATLSDGTNPVTGATLIGSVGAMRGKISEFEDKGNGEYSAEYTPPASVELETKVTIYVSASKYGCISITTSINITVLPQPKLSITLTTTSNTILADLETAIITAHVSNGISPIIDANLVANIEPNIGTISSFEAIGSGNYQAKYTPGDIRNATVLTIYVDGGKYGYINGTANIQISVIPAPDFRVTEEDISFSPAKLIVGKKVTISITIRNIWYGNGTNVKVSVYIDDYPLTPEKSISYISGNGFGTVEYSWKATKGRHTLEVFVDQTNAIKEKNEGNNEALKDFNVKEEQKPTPGYEAIFIILCLIIYVGMSQHCKGTKHL